MAGEMLMKLLLNTKEFDSKLKKTNKELYDFGKSGGKAIDDFIGKIGKIAGAAGIAMGGFELIQKGINSCQAGTDAWGRTMESVKTVTDELIYSIATFDDSSLFNGLDSLIDRAQDLYDAFDKLANVKMSANFSNTLDQSEFKRLMVKARNKQLSPEERQAALDQAKVVYARIEETSKVVAEASLDAVKKTFAKKSNVDASLFSKEMIEDAFRIDARSFSEDKRAEIEKSYKNYTDAIKKINKKYYDKTITTESGVFVTEDNSAIRNAAYRELEKNYAQTIVEYVALMKLRDEELQTTMNTYASAVQSVNMASETMGQTNEVQATLVNELAAEAKKQSAEAKKQSEAAKKEAAEAKALADEVSLTYAGASNSDTGMVGGFNSVFDNSFVAAVNFAGKNTAAKYSNVTTKEYIKKQLPKTISMIDIPFVTDSDTTRSKMDNITEGYRAMSDTVLGLAGAFSTLNGAQNDNLSVAIDIITSASKMVEGILLTISALSAETTARQANAAAIQAENAAKAAGSLAWIPVVGGIASIITGGIGIAGALKNSGKLPKFAEGGIVTSATLGVFGEAGPEAVMPLDKIREYVGARDVRVSGEVRAQGKDLVVVIDNYDKVRKVNRYGG